MPVLNGYEATRILKADIRFKHIPVIALTALAMKEQKDKYKDIFDDYLNKPTKQNKLVLTLMKFLPYEKEQRKIGGGSANGSDIELPDKLPNEFIDVLKAEIFPLFNDLTDFFDTEDSLNFIGRLSEQAKIYNFPEFEDYCSKLGAATKKMQIKRINQLLNSFKEFKNNLLHD